MPANWGGTGVGHIRTPLSCGRLRVKSMLSASSGHSGHPGTELAQASATSLRSETLDHERLP